MGTENKICPAYGDGFCSIMIDSISFYVGKFSVVYHICCEDNCPFKYWSKNTWESHSKAVEKESEKLIKEIKK